jgi:hypothetical protein
MVDNPHGSELRRGGDLKLVAAAVAVGSLLIFAGLVLVSLAVLTNSSDSLTMGVLADRRVHYALMGLLVAFYIYLQRR